MFLVFTSYRLICISLILDLCFSSKTVINMFVNILFRMLQGSLVYQMLSAIVTLMFRKTDNLMRLY